MGGIEGERKAGRERDITVGETLTKKTLQAFLAGCIIEGASQEGILMNLLIDYNELASVFFCLS